MRRVKDGKKIIFLARTAGWKVMPLTKIESIGGRIDFWIDIRSFTFSILCF